MGPWDLLLLFVIVHCYEYLPEGINPTSINSKKVSRGGKKYNPSFVFKIIYIVNHNVFSY